MPWTTPLTRRLARDLGVDLEQVRGTGRGGRITRADVQAAAGRGAAAGGRGAAAAAQGPAPHPPEGAPHPQPPVGGPPTGRVAGPGEAGEPLSTAPTPATLPLVHLTVAVDAEALLDLKDELGHEAGVPDLVARACAAVLRADPGLNAALADDALALAHLNVDQLRAVVEPPAVAVLSFGAVVPEVVAAGDGIEVRRRMRVTLSVDDRAMDGATGARFLGQLKAALEHPVRILA